MSLEYFAQAIERCTITFFVNLLSKPQKVSVPICCVLLRHKLEKLIVVRKLSRQLWRVWESILWEKPAKQFCAEDNHANKIYNQASRLGKDISTNNSRWSGQTFSGVNFSGSLFRKSRWKNPASWRNFVISGTASSSYWLTHWKLYWIWTSFGFEVLQYCAISDFFGFETVIGRKL